MVVAVLLGAGCGAQPADPPGEPPGAPAPPRPEVGQCYLMDREAVASFAVSANDLDAVPCTDPHDAETVAVLDYPPLQATMESSSAVSAAEYERQNTGGVSDSACERCSLDLTGPGSYLGGSVDDGLLIDILDAPPNDAEWAAGVFTVRCLLVGPDGWPLDSPVRGELPEARGPVTVPCSEEHLTEQVGPPPGVFDADAQCDLDVAEYLGAPPPAGYVAEVLVATSQGPYGANAENLCVLARADGATSTGSVQ